LVAGKPETPLHAEAVRRTGAQHPLVVGDRLDTDIEGAVRAGADSLLVLTGVTDAQRLLCARPHEQPTYIAADLRGLLSPHPEVAATDGVITCGAWAVSRDGDVLHLAALRHGEQASDDVDALRALSAAAWADDGWTGLAGPDDVLDRLGLRA
jgi:hypothetical protein